MCRHGYDVARLLKHGYLVGTRLFRWRVIVQITVAARVEGPWSVEGKSFVPGGWEQSTTRLQAVNLQYRSLHATSYMATF